MFLELNSKGLYQSSGKEKGSCFLVFPSSTKREIRHFHIVVVQQWLRNVQKSRCTCKVVVSLIKTYCFFAVLIAVAVVVLKLPIIRDWERRGEEVKPRSQPGMIPTVQFARNAHA